MFDPIFFPWVKYICSICNFWYNAVNDNLFLFKILLFMEQPYIADWNVMLALSLENKVQKLASDLVLSWLWYSHLC